jgi:cell division protein FtsW (lipid II flippase)
VARERNLELVLLLAAAGFAIVGWRALDASPAGLPDGSSRVLAQFLLTLVAGHIALRIAAPRASVALYATASLLAAAGLLFATRLAPGLADQQANWISLGTVLMAAAAAGGRRYELLRRQRYTAALLALVLLVITGLFGTTVNGARLWLNVGGQLVQTTEIIKVFVVVFLAGYLAAEAPVLSVPGVRLGTRTYSTLPRLIPLFIALGAAIGALALLRDLGSIAILLLFAAATLYVATGRARFLAGSLVVMLAAGALGYLAFDHARVRIETWLDPYADPDGAGYQPLQAMYALQAGGVTGEGPGLGHPDLVPAAPTDYVFAAIGEELGLAGALGIVLLYLVFLFAAFRASLDAPDRFGRLLAASIGLLIAIQAAVIIAGNLRLAPTTGITLPFVSYGGSSVVVNYLLVGLLAAVSHRGGTAPR